MAEDRKPPHSLRTQTADQIRNEQRGGDMSPIDPQGDNGPEGNATLRQVWDQPGGEAYNYRNALVGAGGNADGHDELTAAETPETTKHLSDATLSPDETDATGAAIARAAEAGGGQGQGNQGEGDQGQGGKGS